MSKYNYYAVFGRNRAGVYCNYSKLKNDMRYIDGIKLKGFLFKWEAIQFIVGGLSEVYNVMQADEIDTNKLFRSIDWNYELKDIKKKIDVITIVDEEKDR